MALLARWVTVLLLLSRSLPLLRARVALLLLARPFLPCGMLLAILGLLPGFTSLRFIGHVQCSSLIKEISGGVATPGLPNLGGNPGSCAPRGPALR